MRATLIAAIVCVTIGNLLADDTRKQVLTWKGHTNGAKSVAFSPDGTRLVSASSDQTVKVWDATSGLVTFFLNRTRRTKMS